MRNNLKLFLVLLTLLSVTYPQIESQYDTLTIVSNQTDYSLSHKPVIKESVQVFYNGKLFTQYSIKPIEGIVTFPDSLTNQAIVYYRFARIPVQVGPLSTTLPLLHTLVEPETKISPIQARSRQEETGTITSSGTIFRSIGFSPIGGNDFSGGLQFQLQGDLGDDLFLTGVITDRDIPIQPEGNTQSLEEIDKVYIQVKHPDYIIEAGDINMKMETRLFRAERKLTGLAVKHDSEKWFSEFIMAGTNGEYHSIELKGDEGRQGPYFLHSREGNRDVIVLAGTEMVYLDGNRLLRGENNDYIIDYSKAELTFNPKHIIHTDSDILVEYQYSDFSYSRNVLGATSGLKWDGSELSFSWLREKDIFNKQQQSLSSDAVNALIEAGDTLVTIQSGVKSPTGKYTLENGIYVFWETNPDSSQERYSVTFYSDPVHGSYYKRISNQGRLYFEFVEPSERISTLDLYSPGKTIISPASLDIFHVQGEVGYKEKVRLNGNATISSFDKNLLSSMDDNDNYGYQYEGKIIGKNEKVLHTNITLDYSISFWEKSELFRGSSIEKDAGFSSDWNSSVISDSFGERLIDGRLSLQRHNDHFKYQNASYSLDEVEKHRTWTSLTVSRSWVPLAMVSYNNVVSGTSMYSQTQSLVRLLPGNFHPILKYESEENNHTYRYDWKTAGVEYKNQSISTSAKLGQRVDFAHVNNDSAKLDTQSVGLFGEVDFTRNVRNGWSGTIQYRKRIKDSYSPDIESTDFSMSSITTKFAKPRHPIHLDLHVRTERAFAEQRALIYDSVGVGYGHYRYDDVYNEYIPDAQGDFIAHLIYTGDRDQVSRIESQSKLRILGRYFPGTLFKNFQSISEWRFRYDGIDDFDVTKIFDRSILEDGISREFWSYRQYIQYQSPRTGRSIRCRHNFKRDLSGTDPRGNDLKITSENKIEWRENIRKSWYWKHEMQIHDNSTESTVFLSRNRETNGWWLESGPEWNRHSDLQVKLRGLTGKDRGHIATGDYLVSFSGFGSEVALFMDKRHRINLMTEWVNSTMNGDILSVPPEANRGLPIGESIQITGLTEFQFGRNLTFIGTLTYIDNQRYNQFVAFNGELRATF